MPIESRYQPSKTVRAAWKPLLRLREKALEAQKRTHSLDASVLSSTSSKIGTDTGYETNTILGTEDVSGRLPVQDRVEDDPFFGSVEDLNMEMNWEQIDAWVDNFQAALHESDPIAQSRDMIRTLNWW